MPRAPYIPVAERELSMCLDPEAVKALEDAWWGQRPLLPERTGRVFRLLGARDWDRDPDAELTSPETERRRRARATL